MRILLAILLLTSISQSNGAVKYVPANDSQPLIRRDLLPLDVDAIRDLAEQLAILADGPSPRTALLLRNQVQAITLSQRLSPAQPRARAILEALTHGDIRPQPEKHKAQSAKRNMITTANWLTKLPTNSEGHLLGQLLLDILQPIANSEPALQARNLKEAPKRWKGVVAKIDAFKLSTPPPIIEKKQPIPAQPIPPGPDYSQTALLTEVPMITTGRQRNSPSSPRLVKTSLVITKGNKDGELRLQPYPGFSVEPLHRALKQFFRSIAQPLPKGRNLNVNTDSRRYLPSNQENIAAPLAMMLDAALSGRPLRRNTLFFARLRSDGSLEKPARAWEILLELEKLSAPDGTRIIVGKGLMEEMNAFLVLKKAKFFTTYEVIEASTFQAARQLFYHDGKPSPNLANAIAGYQEVRQKANLATNFNTFLSLATVESRLVKARDLDPQHLSARILATQAIRRPAYFTRFMFAKELDRLLEDISNFKYRTNQTGEREIKDAYKKARESTDPLERLLERSEIAILDDAVNILKELNSVGRVSSSSFQFQEEMQRVKDLETFQINLKKFRTKLREIHEPSKKE